MDTKTVLVSCGSYVSVARVKRLFDPIDVEVRILNVPLAQLLADEASVHADLLLVDDTDTASQINIIRALCDKHHHLSVCMVVDSKNLKTLSLPARVPCDFATQLATDDELRIRIRKLLWTDDPISDSDFVRVGPMTINLATYQVRIDNDPVDLTFTEYSLLEFLTTHPGRIYSREVLLSQVWGFDYYGGSRTVDVQVRRLRAKLGPEMAQHLETVRGAGYMWTR